MRLDGALGDEQLGGELGVAVPARQHHEHLALALRERLEPLAHVRLDGPPRELLDDPPRDRRREQRVAGRHHAHRVDELLGRSVLEQEAARAGLHRLEDVLVALERGEDHHAAACSSAFSVIRRVACEPVAAGHLDVHEHDVGAQAPGRRRGLLAVLRLADHLDVGLGPEDHAEPGADHRLVVGEQDADAHSAPSGVGSLTRTANPPPAAGPALSCPPWSAARSRMPISPRPPERRRARRSGGRRRRSRPRARRASSAGARRRATRPRA